MRELGGNARQPHGEVVTRPADTRRSGHTRK
jgi:hypothetical protein